MKTVSCLLGKLHSAKRRIRISAAINHRSQEMHPSIPPKLLCMHCSLRTQTHTQSEVGVQSNFLLGGRRGEDDFTENVITACALFIAIVIILRLARTSPLRDNLCIPSVGCLDSTLQLCLESARPRPTTSRCSLAQRQAVPLHSREPPALLFDVCVRAGYRFPRRTHMPTMKMYLLPPPGRIGSNGYSRLI